LKETGIFYGSSSGNTETVAMKIFEWIGKDKSSVKDVAESRPGDLLYFDLLILGIPTWGIGEMQDDWAVFLTGLEDLDLTGKKVAIFGIATLLEFFDVIFVTRSRRNQPSHPGHPDHRVGWKPHCSS
jgi:flavodoxin I